MKKIAAIILTLVLSPALAAQEAGSHVYVVSGNVFVSQDKNPAHQVNKSESIVSNTLISTGDNSSARLEFEDGQVVAIQANSSFQVREYRYDAGQMQNSNVVFALLKGGIHLVTGKISQQNNQAFKLLTSSVTIRTSGSEFMVVKAGDLIYSQVLSGNIRMSNAAGMTVLGTGQSAVVTSSGVLATVVSASAIPSGTFGALLSARTSVKSAPVSAAALIVALDNASEAESVKAGEQNEPGAKNESGMSLTGKIGTLGYGAELNYSVTDSVSTRVGFNAYTYTRSANSGQANYDFKWELQTVSAVADWYPFAGSFRTSAGLFYDNNKVSFDANPIGGSFVINGVTYSTAQIGSLQGTMSFSKVAPYIGIGWGNSVDKDKGWGLVTDIGILYQGSPIVDLVVTCTDPLICTQLQTDAAAERTKMQSDLKYSQWWPVASIGITYQW